MISADGSMRSNLKESTDRSGTGPELHYWAYLQQLQPFCAAGWL
jgi:hypothetical protein